MTVEIRRCATVAFLHMTKFHSLSDITNSHSHLHRIVDSLQMFSWIIFGTFRASHCYFLLETVQPKIYKFNTFIKYTRGVLWLVESKVITFAQAMVHGSTHTRCFENGEVIVHW